MGLGMKMYFLLSAEETGGPLLFRNDYNLNMKLTLLTKETVTKITGIHPIVKITTIILLGGGVSTCVQQHTRW